MYEVNKYCFFSDEIENHILVFNSQNNATAILTSQEYDDLIYAKKTNMDSFPSFYFRAGILVEKSCNTFNLQMFNQKIEEFKMKTKPYFTYLVIMQSIYDGEPWEIDLNGFKTSISAIKNHYQRAEGHDLMLILQYRHKPTSKLHEEYVKSIFIGIDYQLDIRIIQEDKEEKQNRKLRSDFVDTNIKKTTYDNLGDAFSLDRMRFLKETITKLEKIDRCNLEQAKKSMSTYISKVTGTTLFQWDLSTTDLICPNLMENFYIIEHAQLVKKCLCRIHSHDNIVGIIDKQIILLNENANQYGLCVDRMGRECTDCRYVYVCMGQNCKGCLSGNIITCMPFGKFIRENLNKQLHNYLSYNC